jgi:hypothetical protein
MQRLLALLVVLLTVAWGQDQTPLVPLDEPPIPSSLHVQVVDASGRTIDTSDVTLLQVDSRREFIR